MSLFFEGDLQAAIASSLQSGKDFAAFIYATDAEDVEAAVQSRAWEEEHFSDEAVHNFFSLATVLLKIRQGSTEFGHLSAFVSDIKVPSVIILRQGQILHKFDTLEALLNHCQLFDQAVQWQRQAALQTTTSQEPASTSAPGSTSASRITNTHSETAPTANDTPSTTDSAPIPQPLPQPQPERTPATRTTPLPLASNDPAPPQTSRGQPSVQTPLDAESLSAQSNATQSWAAQQRQRNLEARQERNRVLKQIEEDKRARKARQAELKNLADQESQTESPTKTQRKAPAKGKSCGIQVRLISGRTIRSTFEAGATPASDLRPWIDGELVNDQESPKVPAYRLKRMGIPPAPTREIGASEEQESLLALDLLPSATLVVTPIHGAAEAYTQSGGGSSWGLLSLPVTIVGGAASMAVGAVGAVGGAITSTLGLGGRASAPEDRDNAATEERPSASSSGARVRTLHEVRGEGGREDQNFYNGNQLSFQSNDSDDR